MKITSESVFDAIYYAFFILFCLALTFGTMQAIKDKQIDMKTLIILSTPQY